MVHCIHSVVCLCQKLVKLGTWPMVRWRSNTLVHVVSTNNMYQIYAYRYLNAYKDLSEICAFLKHLIVFNLCNEPCDMNVYSTMLEAPMIFSFRKCNLFLRNVQFSLGCCFCHVYHFYSATCVFFFFLDSHHGWCFPQFYIRFEIQSHRDYICRHWCSGNFSVPGGK